MIALMMTMLACTGEVDSGTDGDPLDTKNTEGCPNEAAPVITEFTVEEGDIVTNEDGDEQPSVLFTITSEDEDQDLNVVALDLWADETLDGAVDTSGSPFISSGDVEVEDGNCSVSEATLAFSLGIVGDPLEFETEYEFAAISYDSMGNASEVAYATGTTPASL
jgi:hypothetical protein